MLLDTAGTVGKPYGVATALHMVVIDPSGKVAYNGAIDDQPKTEATSLAIATNYVDAALTALQRGWPVQTAFSVPDPAAKSTMDQPGNPRRLLAHA